MITNLGAFGYSELFLINTHVGELYGLSGLSPHRGISIDIDGDGDREIVFTTSYTGSVERIHEAPLVIYDWRDGQLVDISLEIAPSPVLQMLTRNLIVADFNGDGFEDLFVNNFGTEAFSPFPGEQNRLYLSDGNGGFFDATDGLPQLSDTSHGSIAADFDGDGDIDLFINNLGGADRIQSYLIFNDGTGNFSDPNYMATVESVGIIRSTEYFLSEDVDTIASPYHPELLDYDGDGDFDMYFGRSFTYINGERVFVGFNYAVNDGSGHFTLVTNEVFTGPLGEEIYGTRDNSSPEYTAHGDIDNDGDLDLIVYWWINDTTDPDNFFSYFQLFENRGADGYVEVSEQIEGQENPGDALPGLAGSPDFQLVDFDGDGDLDLISSRFVPGDWSSLQTLWFANDGSGNFEQIDPLLYPGYAFFEIADVNGDWIPDIVYEPYFGDLPPGFDRNEAYIGVRLGEITQAVTRSGWATDDRITGGIGNDLLSGLDGNDSLNGNEGNDTLDGGADDDLLRGGAGVDTFVYSGGADVIEDFSGDFLKIDSSVLSGSLASVLSAASVVSGNLVLDFGGGNTLTLNGITDTAVLDGRVEAVNQHDPESDLTGDGTSDILWRNGTTGQYGMFDMAGGTPAWSVLGGESTAWQIGGLGDFDGDGTDDILWRNDTSGGIGFSAMGSGSPTWNGLGMASSAWNITGVGDFNGDGTDDILWQNSSNGGVGMFAMSGGTATWQTIGGSSAPWEIVATGDITGDGIDDIIWRNATTGQVGQFEMSGAGTPTWSVVANVSNDWRLVGTGDLDGDGTDDLLWRHETSGAVGYYAMGSGTPVWQGLGQASFDWDIVGTGDYNGDGTDDILWRNVTTGSVGMYAMDNGSPSWQTIGQARLEWDVEGQFVDEFVF